jgi:UrcA family protein
MAAPGRLVAGGETWAGRSRQHRGHLEQLPEADAMNTRTLIRKASIGALALAALGTAAATLQAAVVTQGNATELLPQRSLSLRGLDLRRPADVAVLYARIRRAAREVCGDPVSGSHLYSTAQMDCIARSVEAAVASINRDELTAYHHLGSRQDKGGVGERLKAGA